jgi:hypothetical protein
VPLYVTECLAIATNARHRKLSNVLVPEVPKYRLDARWLQTLNNDEVITGSFKKKFMNFITECSQYRIVLKFPWLSADILCIKRLNFRVDFLENTKTHIGTFSTEPTICLSQ